MATKKTSKDYAEAAARAHSNLNLFASIAALLESSCLYDAESTHDTATKIIRLCRAQEQRQLVIYDRNLMQIKEGSK